MMSNKRLQIAVFVSGRGSNLVAIAKAIDGGTLDADISLILSSKADAPALEFGRQNNIPSLVIPAKKSGVEARTSFILDALEAHNVDFIALAGYMKMLESEIVERYRNRIVNIHPALLPAFGGKGMYGHHVHEAVLASGVKISGATVHLVDEVYDRGPIVAQRVVPVLPNDTIETLSARVLKAEHSLYPEALKLFTEDRVAIASEITQIRGTVPAYYLDEKSTD
jgi:phosphoribosylglycinamide formyltransferase 1